MVSVMATITVRVRFRVRIRVKALRIQGYKSYDSYEDCDCENSEEDEEGIGAKVERFGYG